MPEPNTFAFVVEADSAGERLDRWLTARLEGFSRHQIQQDIREGRVLVNGRAEPARYRTRPGDRIVAAPHDRAPDLNVSPENVAFDVVYEDDALAVIDKPPGLVVHPAAGHEGPTLAHGLLARYGDAVRDVGGEGRCGIVHRLDKLTSGLLIAARRSDVHAHLTRDLADRRIQRRYLGLVMGEFQETTGDIDRPIARRPSHRKRMGVVEGGREARTSWRVLHQGTGIALVLLRLHTGRTHQIRVHLQSMGRPVVGDADYGWTKRHCLTTLNAEMRANLGGIWPRRQMLHAAGLQFEHPSTGKTQRFVRLPPPDMMDFVAAALGKLVVDPERAIHEDLDRSEI